MRHVFAARVEVVESNVKGTFNPCVPVPDEIVAHLLQEARLKCAPIPVDGTLNGKCFRATVVRYRGIHRLYLNGEMRQAAEVSVGDRVRIALRFDRKERTLPMPKEFEAALKGSQQASAAWRALSPSSRKEILAYLNSLKSDEGLARNVKRILEKLLG